MNRPPTRLLQERYGFEPDAAWMEHLQKASVRFNNGGSGSFVSEHGLVMTNHHVGFDSIAKLSRADHDLMRYGFHASTASQELRCPDLELNVLMSMEDVTAAVKAAVTDGMSDEAAEKARRAVMNTIEQASLEHSGLRSDVVTLYRGGEYHLYRYKRYTDVRLVFAPESAIAFFGGDPDNFEFPRWCLDVAFFRVYDNDEPLHVEHCLRWCHRGAADGDLIFVTGHPGATDRLNTVEHLEFLRDRFYPLSLNVLRRREVLLSTWSNKSLENARRGRDDLLGVQNARKSRLGGLEGLQDPVFMRAKSDLERTQQIPADPRRAISDTLDVLRSMYLEYYLLEVGQATHSELFDHAHTIVRLVHETARPNTERLREYRESNLPSVRLHLFSTAPIYRDLEQVKLADSLAMALELLGPDNEAVKLLLGAQSPKDRAAALVQGTRLEDVAYREELAQASIETLATCSDPMIQLALQLEPKARELRKKHDEKVMEPQRQAYARIAQAQAGTETYPDATFTLRLAFGEVRGLPGLSAFTSVGGLYDHAEAHGRQAPFEPPPRWDEFRHRIDPATPFNFISTADIVGGNSGSPVVNREAELVGLIFDGNIESLTLNFMYTDVTARAVSVDVRAIVAALRDVYQTGALVDELLAAARAR